jgi:hypothetical protein
MEGTEANQVRSVALDLDPARLRQPLQGDFSLQPLDSPGRAPVLAASVSPVSGLFPKALSSLFSPKQGSGKMSFDKLSCQALL